MTRRALSLALIATVAAIIGVSAAPRQAASVPTIAAPPAPAAASAGVRFVDGTDLSGLAAFQHRSGTPAKRYVHETTGSGVALWDFDDDGRLDIYLVNGSTLDAWQRRARRRRCSAIVARGDSRT